MNEPGLPAIDRHQVTRALRVVEIAHPRVRLCDAMDQFRRANVARLHALNDFVPAKIGTDCATDE